MGVLTKAVAEGIIERKKQLLRDIGITEPKRIGYALRETYKEYSQYREVQRLRGEGLSYQKIGEAVGLDKFKVFNWTKKERLPTLFANERFFSKDLLTIGRSRRDDVIKLLAVYSSSKISPKQVKFKAKFPNRENLEAVLEPFFHVFSTVPYIWEDEHGIEFDFCSKPFLEYFNEQTCNNTAVPWKLLQTDEQKEMYFQYFFLRKGFLRYKNPDNREGASLAFSFHNNENLLYDFALLLFNIGLTPNVGKLRVDLFDYDDLKQVREWCLCPDKKKKLDGVFDDSEIPEKITGKTLSASDVFYEPDKAQIAQEYDLVAWTKYVSPEGAANNQGSDKEGYVLSDHVFNMYIPNRFLDDAKIIKTMYLQFYRTLRSNPRFFQFTTLEDNSFYIDSGHMDLVESVLGSIYRKERRFNDAVKLTERLQQ